MLHSGKKKTDKQTGDMERRMITAKENSFKNLNGRPVT